MAAPLFGSTRRLALAFALACGACAGGEPAREAAAPKRSLYKPGQSLDARLCRCQECADRACCSGEPSSTAGGSEATEGSLGLDLRVCSRCAQRAWTVRGTESCAERASEMCCLNSISDG